MEATTTPGPLDLQCPVCGGPVRCTEHEKTGRNFKVGFQWDCGHGEQIKAMIRSAGDRAIKECQ